MKKLLAEWWPNMPGNPLIWMAVLGWIVAAGGYGTMKVLEASRVQAAYDKGVTAGRGSASTATVAAATETAAAEREAIETTPLPADKAAIMDLCKRSASCRERSALK